MKKIYNFKQFKVLEWEENNDIPMASHVSYLDILYDRIKNDISPNISSKIKIDYDRGKKIIIHTDNKKDLKISIGIKNETITYEVKPVDDIPFEFNYNFPYNLDQMLLSIEKEFNQDPNKGLFDIEQEIQIPEETKISSEKKPQFEEDDQDVEPIKNIRHKRSIDIKIIKDILEDSYILDEIDLKDITIAELIRRMLIESRK
jgi:hypothetical protein